MARTSSAGHVPNAVERRTGLVFTHSARVTPNSSPNEAKDWKRTSWRRHSRESRFASRRNPIELKSEMRFYTAQQCEEWLAQRSRVRPDTIKSPHWETFDYPCKGYQFFAVARAIAHSITFRQLTLLWVTEWGIWPSSENWQLYYKLRQTYGDFQLLQDVPGHLFLEYESEDLSTFLQLAMLNGWGGYILTEANYVNAFFSHDEYIEFFTSTPENLSDLRPLFAKSESESAS